MSSVNPTVILIGISCLGFFVVWLLGRRVESFSDAFDSLPAAMAAFGALCLSPVFFYMAWQQFGAKERLQAADLPVCEALGHAVGAQGGRAPRGVWRFEALDASARILAYYEAQAAGAGWQVERRKAGLILRKSDTSFSLWAEPKAGTEEIVFQKGR